MRCVRNFSYRLRYVMFSSVFSMRSQCVCWWPRPSSRSWTPPVIYVDQPVCRFDVCCLSFQGVIDLVANNALVWNGEELGASFETVDIPAEYAEQAAEYREKLVESAVELDDDAMMMYLEVRASSFHLVNIVSPERGRLLHEANLAADYAEQAGEWGEKLVDSAVELDNDAMMMCLEVGSAFGFK